MADDNETNVVDDVIEDQSSDDKSGESENEPTLKEVMQTLKGLQKGYTTTRQEMAELKDMSANQLQVLAERINQTSGAQEGDNEYITVGKLKTAIPEIMAQYETRKAQEAEDRTKQAESILEKNMDEVIDEGVIDAKERQSLWNYAASISEPDLYKAAAKFNRLSQEKKDSLTAKKQARQEEGSKVGTSSKASTGKQPVDMLKIHNTGWDDL